MGDYISREEAIRVIDELYVKRPLESDRFVLTGVGARLEELPAADVRPVVRAFWVGEMDGVGICSNCKRLDHIDPLATHCRYCGAEITEPQTLKNASQNADDDAMMPAI